MSDKLRAPIKDLLDASLEEARVQRMWRGLQQRPARSVTSRRWWIAGVSAGLVLAVLGVLRTPDAGPLAARDASALAFEQASTVLSDGSQIELAAGTRLDLLENTGQSFVLRLERGRARFDVTPGGPRRWRMECGLASVTVVGTALTIERSASTLRVAVAHGIVEVRGERVPGGLRRLTAGQSLSIESQPAGEAHAANTVPPTAADPQHDDAATSPSATVSADPQTDDPSRLPPTAAAPSTYAPPTLPADPVKGGARDATSNAAPAALPAAQAPPTAARTPAGAAIKPPAPTTTPAAHQRTAHAPPSAARTAVARAGAALDMSSATAPAPASTQAAAQRIDPATLPPTASSAQPPNTPLARAVDTTQASPAHTEPATGAAHAPPNADTPVQRAAAQLLTDADQARQRGAPAQALALLRQLLREHPGTSEAGIAGFTLARMQMEQDPRAAAEALRSSLAAATPESLREDALARLVEAYARAGESTRASSTAAEYLRKYPSGRRLAEVERWATQP